MKCTMKMCTLYHDPAMPGLHFIMVLSLYQICYLHFLRNPCHVLTKPQPVALVLSPCHCLSLQVCQYTGMGDGVSVVGSCPEPLGSPNITG